MGGGEVGGYYGGAAGVDGGEGFFEDGGEVGRVGDGGGEGAAGGGGDAGEVCLRLERDAEVVGRVIGMIRSLGKPVVSSRFRTGRVAGRGT